MKIKKLPRGIRKHIRLQKAKIRREVSGLKEQEALIKKTYEKFLKPETKKQ